MKVTAIIAEYNPFHKGHEYQLMHAKESTGADYILVIMSGDFTQRGEPAVIDKYTRAKMAVMNGADLVIELPLYYATGSAEYFAKGAISLLQKLGMVNYLAFGSECGDMGPLTKIADLLAFPSDKLTESISSYIKTGMTFPKARMTALSDLYPDEPEMAEILSSPNNILGIEYIKALKQLNSDIIPFTTKRKGAGYNDSALSGDYVSALSIREAFDRGLTPDLLNEKLPKSCLDILSAEQGKSFPVTLNDFSDMLLYKLMSERHIGFASYFDVTKDLSDRICNHLEQYKNPRSFMELLKTKELTYTRISRALLHILLNIKETDIDSQTYYGRVLAAKKESLPLISMITKTSCIPLITRFSDTKSITEPVAQNQLLSDMNADALYQAVVSQKFNTEFRNENKRRILFL